MTMTDDTELRIRHDREHQRFVARIDGHEARLSYERQGDAVLDFTSTWTPPELRGRGIGGRLVEAGLGHAIDQGLRVIPSCPFVARWIAEHPRYERLLADRR
jgi:hypothetical protein